MADGRGNYSGSGSRNLFAQRILRDVDARISSSGGLSLGPAIAALGPAASVLGTDVFPKLATTGIATKATAAQILAYIAANASGTWGISITGSAPAGSLTGTTLAANVVTSSLTTIGTLVAGAVPYTLLTYSGLTTGQVLRATAATTAAFGALDLANANAVTGDLPFSNFVQASAASRLVGRGSAAGAGDFQELTLGTGISLSGTVLSATGLGGDVVGPASATDNAIAVWDTTSGKLLKNSSLLISGTTIPALTGIGTLASGAVPASLVTAGTFGTGSYVFPASATATTSFITPLLTSTATLGVTSGAGALTLTATAGTLGLVATGANVITFSTNGTEAGRITSAQKWLFGTTTASAGAPILDVVGTVGLVLSDSITDAANKGLRIGLRHYTNANAPVAVIHANSQLASSTVFIGGGTSALNAATQVSIYTAADTTTVTGTLRASWNSAGTFAQVGNATIGGTLGVTGTLTTSSTADFLSQSATSASVNIGTGTGTGSSLLRIRGAHDQIRQLAFRTGNVDRWLLQTSTGGESSGNAGTNLNLLARADDGSGIDTPLSITRAAGGTIAFSSARPITGGTYNGQTISAAASFTGTVAAVTHFSAPLLIGTTRVTAPLLGTTSAVDVVFDRNSVTKLTLGDTLATLTTTLALGTNSITSTGSLGATGARLTKGWFTDLEVTNAIAGSITGAAPAGSLTGATLAAGVTASSLTSVGTLTSLGVGAITSTGLIQTTLTTQQLSLRYDASNHLAVTVSSAGMVTLNATGASASFYTPDPIHVGVSVLGTNLINVNGAPLTGGIMIDDLQSSGTPYLTVQGSSLGTPVIVARYGKNFAGTNSDDVFSLRQNNANRWQLRGSGEAYAFAPATNGDKDLGTTALRINDGWFSGNIESGSYSVGGTAGASGTSTPATGTVTVVNGLVTVIT